MKKTIAMLCTALFAALGALAATWTDPATGIKWTYTVSDGEACVGSGAWYNGEPAIPSSTTGAVTIPSTLGGYPVTSIGEWAFWGCSGLTNVTIPSSVTNIDQYAFYGCSALASIVFAGNAPTCGSCPFYGVKSGCTATVYEGTTGWDDDGDGKWNGLVLEWRKRVFPIVDDDATPQEVAAALDGSADARLAVCITNAANYNAYREWAAKVKVNP